MKIGRVIVFGRRTRPPSYFPDQDEGAGPKSLRCSSSA
jgi:hypothetical protein